MRGSPLCQELETRAGPCLLSCGLNTPSDHTPYSCCRDPTQIAKGGGKGPLSLPPLSTRDLPPSRFTVSESSAAPVTFCVPHFGFLTLRKALLDRAAAQEIRLDRDGKRGLQKGERLSDTPLIRVYLVRTDGVTHSPPDTGGYFKYTRPCRSHTLGYGVIESCWNSARITPRSVSTPERDAPE